MNWPDIYLLCFAVGALWSVATLLLGGAHLGHGHLGHIHLGLNPSCAAVFLAWFGGVGYLLTRHSGLSFWFDLSIALAIGLAGAWILVFFLHFLSSREQPLDPADYEMVGVLGRVSSPIRPGGIGEVIYQRDGARKPLCAKSEEDISIARGEEVIVTRYEKGIAYVRTWEAMTQPNTEP
ncbi:MAG TPA: NfeD family protein [Bryobacteraceae bacterium]|jgi:membrane protein implicated in regulation of membrane protease activity